MNTTVSSQPGPCDLLALVAHPDDAELNCGGTLALSAEQGWKTAVVDFTRGELSTRGTPEIRATESAAASAILGLSYRINLGLADGHLHDCDEHRQAVVRTIRHMRPKVIIAPPLDDHHADHIAVAEIVSRSFYLCGVEKYCPDVEPWRPQSLLHYQHLGSRGGQHLGSRGPDVIVDISTVYEKRSEAVRCYRSQFYDPEASERSTRISHPEFLEWIEGALRHYGFFVGAKYGEAFTSPEPIAAFNLVEQFGRGKWNPPRDES